MATPVEMSDADVFGPATTPAVAPVQVTASPQGDPNAVPMEQIDVTAPSLANAPMKTAGGDMSDADVYGDPGGWRAFSDKYNQTAPSAAGNGDESLGFVDHLTHALSRLDAVNPVAYLDPDLARYQKGTEQWIAGQKAQGKAPGLFGGTVGDMLGTAPAALLPGGPLIQGAAMGAITSHANDPATLARDMAIGAAGNKVGEAVFNGVLNTVAPQIAPSAQVMLDRGTPMTTGMLTGGKGFWGRLEQLSQHFPVAGELARMRGNEALTSLNPVVANEALRPINASVVAGQTGHDTYQAAKAAIDNAYNAVGQGVTSVPLDAQYGSDMQTILGKVAQLPQDFQRRFQNTLQNEVGLRYDPSTGGFTPDALSDAKAAINREIASWPEPRGWEASYVDHLKDTRRALTDMLGRTSPQAQAQLASADAAYPGFATYRQAVRNSTNNSLNPNGYFNAQQLQSAVNRGATTDARAAGTGNPLQAIATAAKDILPTQFKKVISPMSSLIETGVGAGVIGSDVLGGHHAALALAAPVAALAPFYTRPAQTAAVKGLLATADARRSLEGLLGMPLEQITGPTGGLLGSIAIPAAANQATAGY